MEEVKVTRLINGPEAFTPDNEFCLGESEVRGLFVAAGFCAHGLAGAGGIGRVMAEWIVAGEPSLDVWEMDIRRFGPQYASPRYTLARAKEVYETYYDIRYPGHERQAGRPLRTSSAYSLAPRARGRVRREVGLGARQLVRVKRRRRRRVAAPARLGGDALVAGDRSRGPGHPRDARACSTSPRSPSSRSPGRARRSCSSGCATTGWRARSARSPTRRCSTAAAGSSATSPSRAWREETFQIVTGTAFANHDAAWIRRHLPHDGSVRLTDVTSRWACFALWGPAAGRILAPLTPDPLDFGYMTMRELSIGDVPVRALRVTFVGEAGWELYCPTEYGAGLWRTLWEAGAEHGLVAGGYRAIDALRLEKGYRVWAADITPDETPAEAGLEFCVRADKSFVGSDAIGEPTRRLRCLVLEDPRSVALGNEPVRVGDEICGRVTSGGYGYSVRALDRLRLPAGGGRRGDGGRGRHLRALGRAARSSREPLFDPAGRRVRES